MKNLLLAFGLSCSLILHASAAFSSSINVICSATNGPNLEYFDGSNPSSIIQAWLHSFQRLDQSIPTLTPREAVWLEGELKSNNVEREMRARISQEFAIRETKRNLNILTFALSAALSQSSKEQKVRALLLAQSSLLERFAADRIAALVRYRVIDIAVLPRIWTILAGVNNEFLESEINTLRAELVNNIAVCILPPILEIRLSGPW